jgi:hypothetical protein
VQLQNTTTDSLPVYPVEITTSRKTSISTITASRKTTRVRGYIENYHPQAKTQALLAQVLAILQEYGAYLPLTVRQIFYRLIGAYGHPKDERFYARVCEHLNNARRARIIPFDAIRDDGVAVMEPNHFADENDFHRYIHALAKGYERDKLARQPKHIEVWCEAAGMTQQLAAVANPYSISVYSCSGFDSTSAKRQIVDRVVEKAKPAVILHLGDYDPSRESIFRAVAEDVDAFVRADRYDARASVTFKRVALTAVQVVKYHLPTAPAKESDSRSRSWKGETCQLEALAPDQIADLLRAAIRAEVDEEQLVTDLLVEREERASIAYALPAPRGGAA